MTIASNRSEGLRNVTANTAIMALNNAWDWGNKNGN